MAGVVCLIFIIAAAIITVQYSRQWQQIEHYHKGNYMIDFQLIFPESISNNQK